MVPNGWEKHPVGKICSSIVPGRNKPKQFGGHIAWVTTPEIIGKFIPSSVQKNYISEETIKECGGKVVPKGAVVMAAVGDLGLIAITKEEVVLNQQLHAFVCSSKINNEFLAYWLATQTPYMESVASKTTILYLNKTNCESIPVLVPPLPEQQKIAKILSTWDKAISTTERLIDNSTQQKKALMQQLLTGKKRLLDESGKRFESEWEEVTLEEAVKYRRGSFPQPYGNPEWVDEVNGYPFVQVYDIAKNMKLKPDTKMKISDAAIDKSVFIPKETIIVSLQGSIGRVAITQYDAYVDRTILLFQEFLVPMNKMFFAYIIQELFEIEKTKAPGGTIKTITKAVLSNFKVLIPSLKEQQKIATVLTNADKEIELLEQQLADLQQEKKALMQVLLTGKRRV